MNAATFTVRQVLSNRGEYFGQPVAVSGVLAIVSVEGCLVASTAEREDLSQSILVHVAGLRERLLASIPPLGGGKYYYLHSATVTGTLDSDPSQVHACRLVDVQAINVEISGEHFSVVFGGNGDA
jgi:hypothetical protein